MALAILLSLGGLALTGLLLDSHIKQATGGTPIARPLCENNWLGPRFNGTDSLKADWARVPFGRPVESSIPTALLGFIYFTAVSAWFLIVGRPSGSRYAWHWFAVLMTAVGAGLAGFLAWKERQFEGAINPLWAGAQICAGVVFLLALLLWPRKRLVAVMADPVSGPLQGPMPVRVPVPDYPPSRAMLAWVLCTAGIAALGWLGYNGIVNGQTSTQQIANLRRSGDEADQAARQRQQDLELARAEVTAERANGEKLAGEGKTAKEQLKATQDQLKAAEDKAKTAEEQAKTAQEQVATAQMQAKTVDAQRADLAAQLEKLKAATTQPDVVGELQRTKAALAELQQLQTQTAARLKDYEDDYQAVWFNFMNEPVLDVPVDQTDSIRGKVDAPHTIVMYMDLQCPFCQGADKVLKQKLAKYPNQLRLVVKHFPLDKACNPHVNGQQHAFACPAAVTAEAARAVGGEDAFWKMYDELFAHQVEFAKAPREFVKAACERIGINNEEVWKKIGTTSVWDRVKKQTDQAATNGVEATPTIYYDGRKVAGWANSKFWDFIMWREQQAGGTTPTTQPAVQTTQPAKGG